MTTEMQNPFEEGQELLIMQGDRWVKAYYWHPIGQIHRVKVETLVGRLPVSVSYASMRTVEQAEEEGLTDGCLI